MRFVVTAFAYPSEMLPVETGASTQPWPPSENLLSALAQQEVLRALTRASKQNDVDATMQALEEIKDYAHQQGLPKAIPRDEEQNLLCAVARRDIAHRIARAAQDDHVYKAKTDLGVAKRLARNFGFEEPIDPAEERTLLSQVARREIELRLARISSEELSFLAECDLEDAMELAREFDLPSPLV